MSAVDSDGEASLATAQLTSLLQGLPTPPMLNVRNRFLNGLHPRRGAANWGVFEIFRGGAPGPVFDDDGAEPMLLRQFFTNFAPPLVPANINVPPLGQAIEGLVLTNEGFQMISDLVHSDLNRVFVLVLLLLLVRYYTVFLGHSCFFISRVCHYR